MAVKQNKTARIFLECRESTDTIKKRTDERKHDQGNQFKSLTKSKRIPEENYSSILDINTFIHPDAYLKI